ncbi:MAG: helicase-exonuclease AddAB subunit AddA [Clostridiales bacterium]
MNFTSEQLTAIKTRGVNILVSAGAGSGKTGVLTERIVDRLREGEDIDKLLVLTYTKAASGEMMRRIRQKIFENLTQASTVAEKKHWQKQVMLLGDASITTLHSFCLQILKRHYNVIPGLNPEFKILDPSLASVHLHDVLDEFLEECYTNPNKEQREKFFSLLRLYGNRLGDAGLKDEMIHLREFGCAQGDFYQWLLESLSTFSNLDIWHFSALESAAKETETVIDTLKCALDTAKKLNGPEKYIITLENDIKELNLLLNENWHWDTIGEANIFKTLGRKSKDDNEEIATYIKAQRTKAKDYFNKKIQPLFKRNFNQYAKEITEVNYDMETLVELTGEFYRRYQEYKIKKGFLEFNDLEQYAFEILREHPNLAHEYQKGFNEVLIDEYQDVNPLQEKILTHLTNGHNLFVVGDIKQSIYGFRFADHSIFKNRYDQYDKEKPNENGLKILLNKNFRSKEGILAGVNYFFYQWMNENVSQLPYGEDEELIPGNLEMQKNLNPDEPEMEVEFIYKPDVEEFDQLFDDPDTIHYHGRYIAKRIEEMMLKGETVTENGIERPLEYKDIAIIMRTVGSSSPVIEEELILRAIPVTGHNKRYFSQCQEVRVLLSILSVLDNPCQDIPLAAVMRSPFFGFNEDELMDIALCHPGDKLWYRLKSYIAENGDFKEKTQSFQQQILGWRQLSKIYAVGDLLQIIIKDIDYLSFWAGLPGGKNRLENIDVFRSKAISFQESGGGLFDFLRYVQNLQKTHTDVVDHSENTENSVKIMSIHRSKGLEFPVVFCANLENQFNIKDSTAPLLLHNKLGFGPKYKDHKRRTVSPTLPRLLIKKEIDKANMAERLRILYVVMTRAKNKLIFTSALKDKDKPKDLMAKTQYCFRRKLPSEQMLTAQNFNQWLCYGLSRKDSKLIDLPYQNCKIKVSYLPAPNPLEPMEITTESQKLPHKAFDRLEHWLCAKDDITVPGKVSVTSLLPKLDVFDLKSNVRPKFLEDIPKISGSEQGTVFHRFMEKINLGKVWNCEEIIKERDGLIKAGFFTPQEGKALDIQGVEGFFQSEYAKDLPHASKIKRELAFTASFPAKDLLALDTEENTVLQGAVDMVYCRKNGDWVLIDYKTNNTSKYGDSGILARYAKQMELYAMALKHLYGIEIKEAAFYLAKDKRFLRYK